MKAEFACQPNLYNTPTLNSTCNSASPPPQSPPGKLLEPRAIPIGMKLASQVGVIAAIILQHFYYLLVEGYGKDIDGERWLYHPRWEWVEKHFSGISQWEYRKGRDKLKQLGLLKTCRPRAKERDHTNYHTLDYDRLKALILSIGEQSPIDWRPLTNRLVTAHQSTKESEPAAKFLSSSIKSTAPSSHPEFPPQTGEGSTGVTPCNGAPIVASLRANHCIEPPPPCSQNHSHGGGILTASPAAPIQPPVVVESECFDANDDSPAAPPKSQEKPYSRVQLEALKSLGVILNSAIMAQLSKVKQPQQIDDAIACFQEDKQSWAKNKPMKNPSGFFTKVLKQVVNEGRSPLPKSDPLTEDLQMWKERWFNPMLINSRPQMLATIEAACDGKIIVRDWEEGPILGVQPELKL